MDPVFFVNISNHPSAKWGDAQLGAALRMGYGTEIYDVPFPEVDPTSDEMDHLVERVVAALPPYYPQVAMVAGEPVLVVRLVARLQAMGVDCYAATTRRVTTEKDGVKTSTFELHHFRPFPKITLGA